jgi:serralysin
VATPTTNFVPTTAIDPLATGAGAYLVAGQKWGGGLGSGVTLTYSFPTGAAHFEVDFLGNPISPEWNSWLPLSTGEQAAVRHALSVWAGSAAIKFVEVADNSTTVGELRFTYTVGAPDRAAHAYLPSNDPSAGDVWFDWYNFNPNGNPAIPRGTYDYLTILHEVGHALGLKHSFRAPNDIPDRLDNYFYTIMSYTASPWSRNDDNLATFYPTTPMYYDLVAIQALYGRNLTVNAGDNTYAFNDGTRYWQAINDAGGHDAIIYNGVESSSINLNPGRFSAVSETIFFTSASSRATVTIGPGVVIEDARGGSGHDSLVGNGIANILRGGAGNDTLSGQTGNDALYGELGNDSLIGGLDADRLSGGAGADLMLGGFGNDTYVVDNQGDRVQESAGAGTDLVQSSVGCRLAANVENLTLVGTGRVGTGNGVANVLLGNAAANALDGGLGADQLFGGAGPDQLTGGFGNDRLAGRLGADRMAGGAGADLFVFVAGADSGLGAVRDAIQDFAPGIDRCDLRAMDADSLRVGNQAFDFIGARAFSDPGQLRFQRGILSGELNGDRIADFEIAFTGLAALAETDILL